MWYIIPYLRVAWPSSVLQDLALILDPHFVLKLLDSIAERSDISVSEHNRKELPGTERGVT